MVTPPFEFRNPPVNRIVFGPGVVDQLEAEVARLGAERVLVVSSPSVASTALLDRLRRALGTRCAALYDKVAPHSPVSTVEEAARLAREAGAEALVSVGGGSAIDTAKGVTALLAEGAPLSRFRTRFTPPDRRETPSLPGPKLPHLAIPTTLSGAEYTYSAGLTEADGKFLIADPKLAPRVVLLDPHAAATCPPRLLAASGMNALAHCVEALYSLHHQPIGDALCLAGVERLAAWLPRAVEHPDDLAARGEVQLGACLSGLGVYSAWTGIHHAIVHVVGGRFRVSHAQIHAVVLPHAMRFNLDATVPTQARIARAMGVAEGADEAATARAAPERVFEMSRRMGLPLRLRELGVPRETLAQLAEDALGDFSVYTNPKPITSAAQVLAVLEAAW